MRKIKILTILFFLISVLVFGVYEIYEKNTSDTKAPVIQCETKEIVVSVSAQEEELLQGVSAMDDKDGDISSSVVIESISSFTEENTRIITYAVIDEGGNVGRCQRKLVYEDYEIPMFSLSDDLRFPKGRVMDLLERVSAYSSLDGDLTDRIKYTLTESIDVSVAKAYSVEYRVMDETGKVEYLPVEIELYDPTEERIDVVLSRYLVYIPVGAEFEANDYYVGSDIDGELTIQSDVNTLKEGVYYVDYSVQALNSKGKARLIVVVTGK